MQKIILPKPLSKGDHIRIIAPSCSGKTIKLEKIRFATKLLATAGLRVSFGKNVFNINQFGSSDRDQRLSDLHSAFSDPKIDGILAVRGGYNANDLLDYIDWKLIRSNPKVFCGFSDNTALQNAIFTMTSLVTFSGPNLATFAKSKDLNYTLKNFLNAVLDAYSLPIKNNDPIVILNNGNARGIIIGGNLCTLNLLQGTKYMPDITNKILFLEDDHVSSFDLWEFHRNLQSLISLPNFHKVRALAFGKFQTQSNLSPGVIKKILKLKPELDHIPIIANITFGHTKPMLTIPIGGKANIDTKRKRVLQITTTQ